MPNRCGSTPCAARDTIRASGSRPSFSAPFSSPMKRAAAPSLSGDELPAVTVPSLRNTGLSFPSFSIELSGRMPSSRSSSVSGTGTISPSNTPLSHAAAARWWLFSANSSCSSREISKRSARISAPSPSATVHCSGMFGLVMRQPSVVEWSVSWARGKGLSGLSITHGARLIDSTPPAIRSDASPTEMARLASIAASRPEPHRRFTVAPGMLVGSPARRTAMRATSRLSSPAPLASPK